MDGYQPYGRRRSIIPIIILISLLSAILGGMIVAYWFQYRIQDYISQGTSIWFPPVSGGNVIQTGDNPIVPVVQAVSPAVVGITNKSLTYDWYNRPRVVEKGSGSGVIFHPDGYIATNHHVVEGASELVVTLADGQSYPGRIIGLDSISDLAVVKIDGDGFPFAVFGDSLNVKVGETAVAIGNPLGFAQTVTVGVISAINRPLQVDERELVFLQTDAAINAGNSGGPLVNIKGEVIGINTAKIPGAGIEGLGFAIPSSTARPILESLITSGRVAYPWMGVILADKKMIEEYNLSDIVLANGVLVLEVITGSPAFQGGLKDDDIILKISGVPVNTVEALQGELRKRLVGETITIDIIRSTLEMSLSVTLGEAPPQ